MFTDWEGLAVFSALTSLKSGTDQRPAEWPGPNPEYKTLHCLGHHGAGPGGGRDADGVVGEHLQLCEEEPGGGRLPYTLSWTVRLKDRNFFYWLKMGLEGQPSHLETAPIYGIANYTVLRGSSKWQLGTWHGLDGT